MFSMSSFSLYDQVAVVTGGYGVLGSTIADGLLAAGADVVLLGRNLDRGEECAQALRTAYPQRKVAVYSADVTQEDPLRLVAAQVEDEFGPVSILINAAGGNVARSRSDVTSVFDLEMDSFDEVVRLNLHGSVYPSLVFGKSMAAANEGSIVNISSMASLQAISGVMGYSAAKAAIDNFTRWMAVDIGRKHGDGLRVNAVSPGFFVTKQNKDVLISKDGSYTERSASILKRTPMGRFGNPAELVGPVVWLCSPAASFVTGTVIPVDGGFSSFSGV